LDRVTGGENGQFKEMHVGQGERNSNTRPSGEVSIGKGQVLNIGKSQIIKKEKKPTSHWVNSTDAVMGPTSKSFARQKKKPAFEQTGDRLHSDVLLRGYYLKSRRREKP